MVSSQFPPLWGGVGVVAYGQVVTLAARGHQVHVITRQLPRGKRVPDIPGDVHVHHVPMAPIPMAFTTSFGRHAVTKVLELGNDFDVVHNHCNMSLLKRRHYDDIASPVVNTMHGTWRGERSEITWRDVTLSVESANDLAVLYLSPLFDVYEDYALRLSDAALIISDNEMRADRARACVVMFLCLLVMGAVLVPVLGNPGGNPEKSYRLCGHYEGCHGAAGCNTSLASVVMSTPRTTVYVGEPDVIVTVDVTGAEQRTGDFIGVFLLSDLVDPLFSLPSDDGWTILEDAKGRTPGFNYVKKPAEGLTGNTSASFTWRLQAPPRSRQLHPLGQDAQRAGRAGRDPHEPRGPGRVDLPSGPRPGRRGHHPPQRLDLRVREHPRGARVQQGYGPALGRGGLLHRPAR